MIIYLFFFLLSIFSFKISCYFKGNIQRIFVFLGFFFPCFLAGVRNSNIGTDVQVYALPIFRSSQVSSMVDTIRGWQETQPIGFIAYEWLVTRLFNNFSIVLGAIELLIMIPIYRILCYFDKKNVWLGMLIYYLLFYGISLNQMKQSIAMAFVIYSLKFCLNRDILKFVFCIFVATLFHQTAFIFCFLFPLWFLFNTDFFIKKYRNLIIWYTILFSISIIFIFGDRIIVFLASIRQTYSFMTRNIEQTSFGMIPIFILVFLFLTYYFVSKSTNNTATFNYILCLTVVGYILSELSLITDGLNRIAFYLQYYIILLIIFVKKMSKNNKTLKINYIVWIIICTFIFIYNTLNNANDIYPYSSEILGV